jgi:transposase-like protein
MVKAQREPRKTGHEFAVGGERSVGDRREPQRSSAPTAAAPPPPTVPAGPPPDPEVPADRPRRRTFTAEYKKRIIEEADACSENGAIGALLRREGLFSSHLTVWRRQREEATVAGLAPRKRGRKAKVVDALATRVAELERDKQKLEQRLRMAETIIDVQKKVSELLGVPLSDPKNGGND